MNPNTSPQPDSVNILVFKDNLAARNFRVPLQWISRLSLLLGLTFFVSLGSLFLALKYYRSSQGSDPVRVHRLESELADVRASNKSLEEKLSAQELAQSRLQADLQARAEASPAAPLPKEVPPPMEIPASAVKPLTPGTMFNALPPEYVAATEVPISINAPQITWAGKTLRVHFDIQYTKTDKGAQQGRIILLARGPQGLIAYPEAVLNSADKQSLIAPHMGEYFSVGRFREVKAEFPGAGSIPALKEVEILLLSNNDKILVHQVHPIPKTAARAAKGRP